MNALKQSRGFTGWFWQTTTQSVASFGAALAGGLARLGATDAACVSTAPLLDPPRAMHHADLFVQALCDASNLEMDWLWLATQVTRDHERRYCLERALQINPHSTIAQRELATLHPLPAHISRMQGHTY